MNHDDAQGPADSRTAPDSSNAESIVQMHTLGPFATNCFVVHVRGHDECWIVDASFNPHTMIDSVREQNLRVSAIVLTHAHMDHIAGLDTVRRELGDAPVWIHSAEADWLNDPTLNLSGGYGEPFTTRGPDALLEHGQALTLAGSEWRVLHTPGHSPGGIGLYNAASGQLISGDALFAGSVGRMDFPTSDGAALERSIKEHLYTLPDETVVYPGHGPTTTIGQEKRHNPFVRADS